MTEGETIVEIEKITYDIVRFLKEKNVSTSSGNLLLSEETIEPEYIKSIYSEIDRLRKAIAQMVAEFQSDKAENQIFDFFFYFIRRFEDVSRDFIDMLNEKLKESQVRSMLIKLQSIFLRIFSIYTALKLTLDECAIEYTAIKYLTEYTTTQRAKLLATLYKEVEEGEKMDGLHIGATDNQFSSEIAEYFYLINLKIMRTLFCYYTLYNFSNLPSKDYILDTIARALLYLQKLQERLDCANQIIYMKPLNFYQITVKIFNDLDVFLAFTQKLDIKTITQFPQRQELSIIPRENEGEVKGIIELFTSRSCPVCKKLFQTELWEFLQQIARDLKLRIKLVDTYFEEGEAISGIYYIERIPVLKFQNKLYWINPQEQEGQDPHTTVKRELLNFFGILGLYDPKPKEKEKECKSTQVKTSYTEVTRGGMR